VPHDLWAITSYFNPVGYERRLRNYRVFRERLGLPLVAVELAFGKGFELRREDADVLVQLRGGAVLWQKERLLNVALGSLPVGCRNVVAVDCDAVFARSDWGEAVSALLDEVPLAQPFSRLHYLPPDSLEEASHAVEFTQPSVVARIASGGSAQAWLALATKRGEGLPCRGVAWAARRELLDRHGFYDGCIVGGGDTALACAAYGCFDVPAEVFVMNARQRERYVMWAELFHQAAGAPGFLDCEAFHLWHGTIADRRSKQRHLDLGRFGFDPFEDIAVAPNGCWGWSSDKPSLHAYVADYFAGRNEDGRRPAAERAATAR
jgi:hypothetical protein